MVMLGKKESLVSSIQIRKKSSGLETLEITQLKNTKT
jgi:hypothetical protein